MTLQQLRYVVEVFNSGSITAAAQKLFIAQPSLSKAVRELESEIGITIFERGRNGASFTDEGLELLAYARAILEQANSMKTHFSKERENKVLRMSISAQHYIFSIDALIDFVNRRLNGTQHFVVNIRECKTSQVINDVLTQHSQIGILYISNTTRHFMQQLLEKNSLEFHSLGRFSSHVYLRRDHPLAGEKVLTAEQLLPYPCVRYEQGGDSFHFSEEAVVLEDTMRYIYVTDRSTMLSIIRNTDAYNIGSGCLLPNIVDPEIITVPLQNYMDCMQIGWIKLKSAVLQPEMEEYVHLMEESLKKIDRCVGRKADAPKRG